MQCFQHILVMLMEMWCCFSLFLLLIGFCLSVAAEGDSAHSLLPSSRRRVSSKMLNFKTMKPLNVSLWFYCLTAFQFHILHILSYVLASLTCPDTPKKVCVTLLVYLLQNFKCLHTGSLPLIDVSILWWESLHASMMQRAILVVA